MIMTTWMEYQSHWTTQLKDERTRNEKIDKKPCAYCILKYSLDYPHVEEPSILNKKIKLF